MKMDDSSGVQPGNVSCPIFLPLMERLDEILVRLLEDMPAADRLPFLAYLEQKSRQKGNLVGVRAVRGYRAKRGL